jgi:hypothetical protein
MGQMVVVGENVVAGGARSSFLRFIGCVVVRTGIRKERKVIRCNAAQFACVAMADDWPRIFRNET